MAGAPRRCRPPPPGGRRRALAAAGLCAAGLPAVGGALELPPGQQECAACVREEWTCPGQACSDSDADLPLLEFDFSYAQSDCWAGIPADSRTVIVDVHAQCQGLAVGCHNMTSYSFSGLSVLEGCSVDAATSEVDFIREHCGWVCKHGYPFARCSWTFDTDGTFDSGGTSTLEKCWVAQTCRGGVVTKVGVCRPLQIWSEAQLTASENALLLTQLDNLHESGLSATNLSLALREKVSALLEERNLTQADLEAALLRYEEAVEELEDMKRQAASAYGGPSEPDGGSTAGGPSLLVVGVAVALLGGCLVGAGCAGFVGFRVGRRAKDTDSGSLANAPVVMGRPAGQGGGGAPANAGALGGSVAAAAVPVQANAVAPSAKEV